LANNIISAISGHDTLTLLNIEFSICAKKHTK
jgi:hypothetical protein